MTIEMNERLPAQHRSPTPARPWRRALVFGALLIAGVAGYFLLGDRLTFVSLAAQETRLRQYSADQPVAALGVAFAVYAAVTGLSLPGATVLTLAYGWFFGIGRGLMLVSFASTTGATLAFLFSRFLFRDTIQNRLGDRLAKFNHQLDLNGAFYLFTLRLIPAVPFFVINAVMGLTPIRTWTFWWVSQLGMLPGTAVYVYAGSSVPSLQALAEDGIGAVFSPEQLWSILIAFALIGLFPILVRRLLRGSAPASIPQVSTSPDLTPPLSTAEAHDVVKPAEPGN